MKQCQPTNSSRFDGVSTYQGILFFGAFVVLIIALLQGLTPFRSVSISLAVVLVASFVHSSTRLGPTKVAGRMLRSSQRWSRVGRSGSLRRNYFGRGFVDAIEFRIADEDSVLRWRKFALGAIDVDDFNDHFRHGFTVGGLLSVDGKFDWWGVKFAWNPAFGSSPVHFLLWNDVDGDAASCLGSIRCGSDIGRKRVKDGDPSVSVFAGWICAAVCVRV